MALYRTVALAFWTDTKVIDNFTAEDRYFYLYLFTNPHTNLCGCYEVSVKQMAAELAFDVSAIMPLINRFQTIHNVIRYSPNTKEILILNWHKYNWTSSEKFRKPMLKEIALVKEPKFKAYLEKLASGEEPGYGIDTMCIDTSVTVSVSNNNIISSQNTKNISTNNNTENNNVEDISTNIDSHNDEQEDRGTGEGTKAPGWKDVIEAYNRICQSLPKVTKVTEARKTIAKARLHDYGMEEIERLFQLAEESDFLSGRAGKWRASFDWLMKESNAVKVLDGNYQNRQEQSKRTGNAYIDAINNRMDVVKDWLS